MCIRSSEAAPWRERAFLITLKHWLVCCSAACFHRKCFTYSLPLSYFFLTTCRVLIGGIWIHRLAYADDIDQRNEKLGDFSPRPAIPNQLPAAFNDHQLLKDESHAVFTKDGKKENLSLQPGGNINWFEDFTYLCSLITSDNNHSKDISTLLKIRPFNTLIIPIAIYACESWMAASFAQPHSKQSHLAVLWAIRARTGSLILGCLKASNKNATT